MGMDNDKNNSISYSENIVPEPEPSSATPTIANVSDDIRPSVKELVMSHAVSDKNISVLRDQNKTLPVCCEELTILVTVSPQPATSGHQTFITSFYLSPLPEIAPRETSNRGRKSTKSTLLTSFPHKKELQGSMKKKNEKLIQPLWIKVKR